MIMSLRFVKYIPAEIVAAFLAIDGILKAATGISGLTIWIVFAVLLILAPIYTWHATKLQGLPPAWTQVGVSTSRIHGVGFCTRWAFCTTVLVQFNIRFNSVNTFHANSPTHHRKQNLALPIEGSHAPICNTKTPVPRSANSSLLQGAGNSSGDWV